MSEYASDLEAQREEMFRIISEATVAIQNDYEALEQIHEEAKNGILTGPQTEFDYLPGVEGSDPNWERWNNDPDYFGEPAYEETYDSDEIEIIFEQEELCRPYLTSPIRPTFKLRSNNGVIPQSVEVNGQPAEFLYVNGTVTLSETLEADGEYTINIKATDGLGAKETEKEVNIRIDRTPPAAETSGVSEKPGSCYKEAVLTLTSDDPDAELTEFTLDGEPVPSNLVTVPDVGVKTLRVDTPGKHTVTARFIDAAGNESQRIVRVFTVTDGPAGYVETHAPAFFGLGAAAVCAIILAALGKSQRLS